MKLYHYTKFETFVSYILPELQLRFNSFSECNDPFEFNISCVLDVNQFTHKYYREIAKAYEMELKEYRFTCFCKDKDMLDPDGYKLPTMWAHYGQNHEGICIEIDSEKLDYRPFTPGSIIKESVNYSRENSLGSINSYFPIQNIGETIEEYIQRGIKFCVKAWETTSLFTKLSDWQIENEYRIVHKSCNPKYEFLDISEAVTAIYLGVRASGKKQDSDRLRILEKLIDEKNKNRDEKIVLNIMYSDVKQNKNMLDFYDWKNYQTVVQNNNARIKNRLNFFL